MDLLGKGSDTPSHSPVTHLRVKMASSRKSSQTEAYEYPHRHSSFSSSTSNIEHDVSLESGLVDFICILFVNGSILLNTLHLIRPMALLLLLATLILLHQYVYYIIAALLQPPHFVETTLQELVNGISLPRWYYTLS